MSMDVVREEKLITSNSCKQEEMIRMDSSLFCWGLFTRAFKNISLLAVRNRGNASQVHYSLQLQMTKKSKPILRALVIYFYFI